MKAVMVNLTDLLLNNKYYLITLSDYYPITWKAVMLNKYSNLLAPAQQCHERGACVAGIGLGLIQAPTWHTPVPTPRHHALDQPVSQPHHHA